MNKKLLKKKVRALIAEVLSEQEEKPKEEAPKEEAPKEEAPASAAEATFKVAKGAYGTGGRFKSFVKEADARALKEPKALMRDLGVESAVTGKDVDQVKRIIDLAIHSNDTMRQAYGGAAEVRDTLPDGTRAEGVGVYLAELDQRNAIKFLMHILLAARRAGFLNPQESLILNKAEKTPILIYPG